VNVTNTSDLHEDFPAWTPDGRLVFTRRADRGKEANELWIATADGGSARRLLGFPALAPRLRFFWADFARIRVIRTRPPGL